MRVLKKSFNLKAFESLPKTLKPSDYVDFIQFFVNEKPVIRLGFNKKYVYNQMILWSKNNQLAYVVSQAGYMYIAKNFFLVNLAKIIDDSTFKHTFLLGKIFGYPTCCSRKISKIGEENIDKYEKIVSMYKFKAPFDKINPAGYTKGYSLISHIPCCETCKSSLKKAIRANKIIKQYQDHPAFENWKKHHISNL